MTTPRPYHSPLRSEQARQTRAVILRAARRLFEDKGFAVTTINDIAEQAAVSVPTIYATFGSKAGLVTGLLDQLEADATAGVEGDEPPTDADAALTRWLESHTRLFEKGRPLLRIVMQALGEPGVAELAGKGDQHRRQALEGVITRLAEADRLRTTVDSATADSATADSATADSATRDSATRDIVAAVDQAWALSAVGVYLDLTDRCGWTTAQYRTWLEDAIRRLLVRP